MKFSEASRLLEEGKRIRKKSWDECCYIYIGDDGFLLNEDGCYFEGYSIIGEWEEYIEATDINVPTTEEIEELDISEFAQGTAIDYKIAYKLNEVINKVNAQTEVLLAQEKEIKEIKEQLDY